MTSITAPGSTDKSLDPRDGGTYREKPIWDLTQIEENLNRTGYDWYTNNYGELDDGVLNFGFWKNIEELNNSYYVNETGTIAFNEAYYSADFSAFNAGQIAVAVRTIGLWNDLIAIDFKETKSGDADITYGNTYTGGAQAYAYLPFGDTIDEAYKEAYDFNEAGRLGGDVWIDGFVASNFNPLANSYYATTTMIHETGHALGLSHPGDYNATDDNDGDGVPDPITYEDDAFFAQDSLQYSIMSYFDGYETGAQFIDFKLLNFAYPSTPMIHDIAAIQAIYGADMTTRTGDSVYGFNSTEAGTAYDFTSNTRPVLSIWDAGGNDTLDLSGYDTRSIINLNAGSFSSAGGADHFYSLEEINAERAKLGFAPRTQATYDYYQDLIATLGVTNPLFKDNISIAYGVDIENAIGGKGNDTIIVNDLANVVRGGKGLDTISYETAATGINISLGSGKIAAATLADGSANGAAGDQSFSIENAIGSKFNDRINGTNVANVIDAGRGDDYMIGRGGADTFVIRSGNERFASGHDTIKDFSNNDMLAVTRALPTDGSGYIAVTGGVLVLDAVDGDSVTFLNGGADAGLRYVGMTSNGLYYYVSAENTTASQATIDKLAGPAPTLEDAAVVAPHDAIAVDLSQRADGWNTGAAPAPSHSSGGAFTGRVDFATADVAPADASSAAFSGFHSIDHTTALAHLANVWLA